MKDKTIELAKKLLLGDYSCELCRYYVVSENGNSFCGGNYGKVSSKNACSNFRDHVYGI